MKPIWAIGAVACLVAPPAFANDVTVDSYAGAVTVAANPDKIAVLDVAAIDILDALGVAVDGVPETLYVDYLADVADSAEVVGSLFEPNYEALAVMAPDLIVAGGRSSRVVGDLAKISATVDMTVWGDDHVGQVLSRLNALAKITGTQDRAADLQSEFEAKLDSLRTAVKGQGRLLVLMTNGGKVSAYGAGSRFGWLHSALDFPEAIEGVDAQTHGEAVSFEFVAEANPDWLFVIDRSVAVGAEGEAAQATLDNPLVAGTNAARTGQIVYLNAANIYIAGGGIQSMSKTLDELLIALAK